MEESQAKLKKTVNKQQAIIDALEREIEYLQQQVVELKPPVDPETDKVAFDTHVDLKIIK
jgi:hypothetical protein